MRNRMKVVLTEADLRGGYEEEKKRFDAVGAVFIYLGSADHETVKAAAADCDALMVSYVQIDSDIIEAMTKCRSISKFGIGVNNIDVRCATEKGIRVMNVPDYCIEEVSDTVLAMFLSLSRGTPFFWKNVQEGRWTRDGYDFVRRIRGKTVSFLGFGNIARRAAEKIRPFGVRILAYDPFLSEEKAAACGAQLVGMDEALREADYVSLNLPLNEETAGSINADIFRRMKKTAFIINTARGGLINEDDLCEAILSGEIAGAGLDVICDEHYDPNNRLFSLPNTIITPHTAYYSPESELELRAKAFDDVIAVLEGKEPKYQLNRR